jgi:hypothetical protein
MGRMTLEEMRLVHDEKKAEAEYGSRKGSQGSRDPSSPERGPAALECGQCTCLLRCVRHIELRSIQGVRLPQGLDPGTGFSPESTGSNGTIDVL